jgi:hypothetical protein
MDPSKKYVFALPEVDFHVALDLFQGFLRKPGFNLEYFAIPE